MRDELKEINKDEQRVGKLNDLLFNRKEAYQKKLLQEIQALHIVTNNIKYSSVTMAKKLDVSRYHFHNIINGKTLTKVKTKNIETLLVVKQLHQDIISGKLKAN